MRPSLVQLKRAKSKEQKASFNGRELTPRSLRGWATDNGAYPLTRALTRQQLRALKKKENFDLEDELEFDGASAFENDFEEREPQDLGNNVLPVFPNFMKPNFQPTSTPSSPSRPSRPSRPRRP